MSIYVANKQVFLTFKTNPQTRYAWSNLMIYFTTFQWFLLKLDRKWLIVPTIWAILALSMSWRITNFLLLRHTKLSICLPSFHLYKGFVGTQSKMTSKRSANHFSFVYIKPLKHFLNIFFLVTSTTSWYFWLKWSLCQEFASLASSLSWQNTYVVVSLACQF